MVSRPKFLSFSVTLWLFLKAGFLLRFVKGGNTFAIAGGRHLVNVSQGMLGVRWPQEEWKANMVELKVSVVFDERKCANQGRFLYT